MTPKIALIGAGPTSLTLAAILHRNNISFTIYEAAPSLRHQGGTLDLHPQTGQQALREAGLWDKFVKYARPESDCLKLVNFENGEVFWDENAGDGRPSVEEKDRSIEDAFKGRPEIDREWLLRITYGALPEGSVKWGTKLEEVLPNAADPKKHDLHFADGSKEEGFDLVVGGDGAWSKVRKLLTNVTPQYSGISAVEIWHNDVQNEPWLLNYVGAGSCFAFAEGSAIMSQRQGDGSLRTYACLRVPETFIADCGIDWDNKDTAHTQFINRYFNHVSPDLHRLLTLSKDKLTPRALYELPIGFSYSRRPGVTLIGDAAHLMTPFAGVGVNVGMTDSLVLAREIIASCRGEKSLDEAVAAYEEELWPRARKFMEKTAKGKERHFRAGGSKEMADMLKAFHAGQNTPDW
ncbi:monooxygenase [Karstenula rhodostoma CBS 690.94]|uniref:Monooxygenase n=1 Tax=Karstenula rhodostoma CBS 690.94 TaxID=1392251 RepID=A0A9P4U5W2_9PLEO|nr:monooxygenase [Karstenula rhodostoma CBS 690.94]